MAAMDTILGKVLQIVNQGQCLSENVFKAVDDVRGFCYNGKHDHPWYFGILP